MNITAYLHSLGICEQTNCDLTTLTSVYAAHLSAIPYNNTLLYLAGRRNLKRGTAYSTNLDNVLLHLVQQKRGGYCYQTSELLFYTLVHLGFDVQRLFSYVLLCDAHDHKKQFEIRQSYPSTHNVLLVRIQNQKFLIDPGFSTSSLLEPLPIPEMDQFIECQQHNLSFRLSYVKTQMSTSRELRLDFRHQKITSWQALYQFPLHTIDVHQALKANDDIYCYQQNIPIRDDFFLCSGVLNHIAYGQHEIRSNEERQLIYSKFTRQGADKLTVEWCDLPEFLYVTFNINPYPQLIEYCRNYSD